MSSYFLWYYLVALVPSNQAYKANFHHFSSISVSYTHLDVYKRQPVECLLGERNNGFKIALNALNVGRIKLSAACLDAQIRIFNHSVQYANERKQFNTPIATFGAIRKKLAEMATATFVSEAGSYRAAQDIQDKIDTLVAGGMNHQEAELKGVEEYACLLYTSRCV